MQTKLSKEAIFILAYLLILVSLIFYLSLSSFLVKNSSTTTFTSTSTSSTSTSTISCYTCLTEMYQTEEACLANKPSTVKCPYNCCPSCPVLQCVQLSNGWCWECGWWTTTTFSSTVSTSIIER